MRKRWLVGLILLGIAVAAVSYASWPKGPVDEGAATATLRQVDDWPLYVLRYEGDYGFGEYLRTGEYPSFGAAPVRESAWACTCFAALNPAGDRVFGRNFDWHEHPALLLFTDPPDGYASVSMVDISYLGFDRAGNQPQNADELKRAPYMPFDGMNERGLAVGMMALDSADAPNDPSKRTLDSLEVIRLLLDLSLIHI